MIIERIEKLENENANLKRQVYRLHKTVDKLSDSITKLALNIKLTEGDFEAICAQVGTTPQEIRGPRRDVVIVNKRYLVAKELYERNQSYTETAKTMNRDHTTIIHLLNRGIK